MLPSIRLPRFACLFAAIEIPHTIRGGIAVQIFARQRVSAALQLARIPPCLFRWRLKKPFTLFDFAIISPHSIFNCSAAG